MYNKAKVWGGILVFLMLVGIPLWLSFANHTGDNGNTLKQPVILSTAGETCVEDKAYMRSKHMVMLNKWRDEVVRENKRDYTNSKGVHFEKSLSETCLGCHSNKKEFCDTCHTQASVKTYCFDCHLQPEQMQKGFNFQESRRKLSEVR